MPGAGAGGTILASDREQKAAPLAELLRDGAGDLGREEELLPGQRQLVTIPRRRALHKVRAACHQS